MDWSSLGNLKAICPKAALCAQLSLFASGRGDPGPRKATGEMALHLEKTARLAVRGWSSRGAPRRVQALGRPGRLGSASRDAQLRTVTPPRVPGELPASQPDMRGVGPREAEPAGARPPPLTRPDPRKLQTNPGAPHPSQTRQDPPSGIPGAPGPRLILHADHPQCSSRAARSSCNSTEKEKALFLTKFICLMVFFSNSQGRTLQGIRNGLSPL
ncbi:unnamed protein product, partial [Rangifer tarandus platyrhynchus]